MQIGTQAGPGRRKRYCLKQAKGQIAIQAESPEVGATTFTGLPRSGDSWRRLARLIRSKARQSSGSTPTWLRIDVLDGLFQFTDWSRLPVDQRLAPIAEAVRIVSANASHIQGVILSTGLAVMIGATDPGSVDEDQTDVNLSGKEPSTLETHHTAGSAIRRLIAPHLARETVVLPISADAGPMTEFWSAAYRDEPG